MYKLYIQNSKMGGRVNRLSIHSGILGVGGNTKKKSPIAGILQVRKKFTEISFVNP